MALLFDDERRRKRSCPSFGKRRWGWPLSRLGAERVEEGEGEGEQGERDEEEEGEEGGPGPHKTFCESKFLNQGAKWVFFCFLFLSLLLVFLFFRGRWREGDWVAPLCRRASG